MKYIFKKTQAVVSQYQNPPSLEKQGFSGFLCSRHKVHHFPRTSNPQGADTVVSGLLLNSLKLLSQWGSISLHHRQGGWGLGQSKDLPRSQSPCGLTPKPFLSSHSRAEQWTPPPGHLGQAISSAVHPPCFSCARSAPELHLTLSHQEPVMCCRYNPAFRYMVSCSKASMSMHSRSLCATVVQPLCPLLGAGCCILGTVCGL